MRKSEKKRLLTHYKDKINLFNDDLITEKELNNVKRTIELVLNKDDIITAELEIRFNESDYMLKKWRMFCKEWAGFDRIIKLENIDLLKNEIEINANNDEIAAGRIRLLNKFIKRLKDKTEFYNKIA